MDDFVLIWSSLQNTSRCDLNRNMFIKPANSLIKRVRTFVVLLLLFAKYRVISFLMMTNLFGRVLSLDIHEVLKL